MKRLKINPIHSSWIRDFQPNQSKVGKIRIENSVFDQFELEFIRIKNLVRIKDLEWTGMNRIKSDWFITDCHRTRFKKLSRLVKNGSDLLRLNSNHKNVLNFIQYGSVKNNSDLIQFIPRLEFERIRDFQAVLKSLFESFWTNPKYVLNLVQCESAENQSDLFRLNSKPSIGISQRSKRFGLKIRFGSIRVRIHSD